MVEEFKHLREDLEGMGKLRDAVSVIVKEVLDVTGAGMIVINSGSRKDGVLEAKHLMAASIDTILGERFTPDMGGALFNCTRTNYYSIRYAANNRMETDKRFANRVKNVLRRLKEKGPIAENGKVKCNISEAVKVLEGRNWKFLTVGKGRTKYSGFEISSNGMYTVHHGFDENGLIGRRRYLNPDETVVIRMKK